MECKVKCCPFQESLAHAEGLLKSSHWHFAPKVSNVDCGDGQLAQSICHSVPVAQRTPHCKGLEALARAPLHLLHKEQRTPPPSILGHWHLLAARETRVRAGRIAGRDWAFLKISSGVAIVGFAQTQRPWQFLGLAVSEETCQCPSCFAGVETQVLLVEAPLPRGAQHSLAAPLSWALLALPLLCHKSAAKGVLKGVLFWKATSFSTVRCRLAASNVSKLHFLDWQKETQNKILTKQKEKIICACPVICTRQGLRFEWFGA